MKSTRTVAGGSDMTVMHSAASMSFNNSYLPLISGTLDEFMKHRALFQVLPKNFVPKSSHTAQWNVLPTVDYEQLIGLLKLKKSIVWSHSNHGCNIFIAKMQNNVLLAQVLRGFLTITILNTSSVTGAQRHAVELAEMLKPVICLESVRGRGGIWINVTHRSIDGDVKLQDVFIQCSGWAEIRNNYASSVSASIEKMVATPSPWKHGKLIIWHGAPGTGKSYALRSLLSSWAEIFNYMLIVDPEEFARDPDYYYKVAGDDKVTNDELGIQRTAKPNRKLFIMEDAADLVIQGSRGAHYDKIGKLLNLTDGIIGAGKEDLFIVTFNERMEEIDPAFLRPGRCIASVPFVSFNAMESERWLQLHRVPQTYWPKLHKGAELTLAELYQALRISESSQTASAV